MVSPTSFQASLESQFTNFSITTPAPSAASSTPIKGKQRGYIIQNCMNSCGFPEEIALLVNQYVVINRVTLLYSTIDSILYEIAAGQPTSNEPCSLLTEQTENRTYVYQKGSACLEASLHSAFQLIHFSVGTQPSPDLQEKRRMELACSEYHTEHSDWYFTRSSLNDMLKHSPTAAAATRELQREKNTQCDAKRTTVSQALRQFVADKQTRFSILQDFLKWRPILFAVRFIRSQQFTTQSALALVIKKENLCNFLTGLEAFDTEVDAIIAENNSVATTPQQFETGFAIRDQLYRAITTIQATRVYQLTPSTWQPSKGFELLMNELRQIGPLVMKGWFSPAYYCTRKAKLTNESHPEPEVFEWKINTTVVSSYSEYAIIVVGAQREQNANYVYYVKLTDESDPDSNMRRTLYKISDLNFQGKAIHFAPEVFAYGRGRR